MTDTAKAKYLIIGNSAGGIGAAEAIRQVDPAGSMLIVSDEPYPAYSRPMLSEYLAKKCSWEQMLFRPADFYQKNNIRVLLGCKVSRLDTGKHVVELVGGGKIIWEKLLLATGGLPVVPEIPGIRRKGTYTFTTLDDAKALDQSLSRGAKVVVIGGGLIGVSVTEALVKRGVKVTMVELKERILSTILDEEASALVAERLEHAGVDIITGYTVAEVGSYLGDAVTGVTLDNGVPLPCNRVIVAIGVRPRTELAENTGIRVNRGIVVDRHMATSCPDVYACGDASEAYDFVYDENRVTAIWPGAYLGGRAAGFNMAGVPTEYPGSTSMNSLKYFGLAVVSAGLVTCPDASYEVLSRRYDSSYHKVILKDGLVVGLVFAGNIERAGIVFNLMKTRVRVADFKAALVTEDFGLVALPEEMWRTPFEMPCTGSVSPRSLPRI